VVSHAGELGRRRKLREPHFHRVSGFDGAEPSAILALLTRLRSATDEVGVTMGEALYQFAYRLCVDARHNLIQEAPGTHASPVCTSFPNMLNYLLRRCAQDEAFHKAELELRNAANATTKVNAPSTTACCGKDAP